MIGSIEHYKREMEQAQDDINHCHGMKYFDKDLGQAIQKWVKAYRNYNKVVQEFLDAR